MGGHRVKNRHKGVLFEEQLRPPADGSKGARRLAAYCRLRIHSRVFIAPISSMEHHDKTEINKFSFV